MNGQIFIKLDFYIYFKGFCCWVFENSHCTLKLPVKEISSNSNFLKKALTIKVKLCCLNMPPVSKQNVLVPINPQLMDKSEKKCECLKIGQRDIFVISMHTFVNVSA